MTHLYVVVVGQTEEAVVKHLLSPHLEPHGVWATPVIVTTSRDKRGRKHKGGGYWRHWHRDLRQVLQDQAPRAWVTTMFDLYGLPSDFPDREQVYAAPDADEKVRRAERAIADALRAESSGRLIPYIQRHEVEALVLARLDVLASLLDDPRDLRGLDDLRRDIAHLLPEDVNHGEDSAPSKRLERHLPGYDKVLHGDLALGDASVVDIAKRCPHFGSWVQRLEGLGV